MVSCTQIVWIIFVRPVFLGLSKTKNVASPVPLCFSCCRCCCFFVSGLRFGPICARKVKCGRACVFVIASSPLPVFGIVLVVGSFASGILIAYLFVFT